jgi:hypothetical protein
MKFSALQINYSYVCLGYFPKVKLYDISTISFGLHL